MKKKIAPIKGQISAYEYLEYLDAQEEEARTQAQIDEWEKLHSDEEGADYRIYE